MEDHGRQIEITGKGTYYPNTNPVFPRVVAKESSARECGCDSGANYRCGLYPTCPVGVAERIKLPEPTRVVHNIPQFSIAQPSPYSDKSVGIGGAPTRPSTMPTDAKERKEYPIATGFLDYFPDAIIALSHLSWVGNQQHNPGSPLHWDRSKSADEADTTIRHFMERGTLDKDGVRHSVKFAWRALALLQKEIEDELATQPRGV